MMKDRQRVERRKRIADDRPHDDDVSPSCLHGHSALSRAVVVCLDVAGLSGVSESRAPTRPNPLSRSSQSGYALAQTLRTRVATPLVRFEGLPGEFSQHDFGEVLVTYQNGTETKVLFFVSRLKYSRGRGRARPE